ncbi:hypothetical protein [Capnocytophaga canis]|uniref:hypothetical protein n=1 Tax=Capnocytophaga canis TaxID=1848903 RepID=UPI0015622606|nr:hypothetical protein [Capnocytophaga canis]
MNNIKKIILLVITAISIISCGQEKKNDLQKAKVKSVRVKSYHAVEKFGEVVKDTLQEINQLDFLMEDHFYILYNEKGNKIEEVHEGLPNKEFTYVYKNEKLVEKKGKNSFYGESKNIYIYNELGNLRELSTYNADGGLIEKRICKYDTKKNNIETNVYNSDGVLKTKLTYKYDDKGNTIEINSYNSEGGLEIKYTYKYDEKGNTIEKNEYYPPNSERAKFTISTSIALSQMSVEDDKEEKVSNFDGSVEYRTTYKYDENGEIIEKKNYRSQSNLEKRTYTYEYDKYGNWVKRITYKNDKPKFIAEREIEYYE